MNELQPTPTSATAAPASPAPASPDPASAGFSLDGLLGGLGATPPVPGVPPEVLARAGAVIEGDGEFRYEVAADGTFEVIGAPAARPDVIGRVLRPDNEFAASWQVLCDQIVAEAPLPAPAPAADTAVATDAAPAAETAGLGDLVLGGLTAVGDALLGAVGSVMDVLTGDAAPATEPAPTTEPAAPADAAPAAPVAQPIDPANHQSRSTFVGPKVLENAATTAILDTIWPYYNQADTVYSGFLTDTGLIWKVNYHWDAIQWTCDRVAKLSIADDHKAELASIASTLVGLAPNPGKGAYVGSSQVGEPVDDTGPEAMMARYDAVKAAKPRLKAVLDAADVWSLEHDPNVTKSYTNACDFIQPPSKSKHGLGYALDFKTDDFKRVKATSYTLGATADDATETYPHIEFADGAHAPGAAPADKPA